MWSITRSSSVVRGSLAIMGPDPWYDVKAYGAKGDGTTDDTVAIQSALDAIRASGRGGILFIPPGTYSVTTSLNASAIPGLVVMGAGVEQSRIVGTLAAARPVIDFIGSGKVVVRDLSVDANATASCGILFARAETTLLGDFPYMSNVQVNAPSSLCGVAIVTSDLSQIEHCSIYGGTAVFYGSADVLGVTSAYGTVATSATGNTQHVINGGALVAHANGSGPCIRFDTGAAFSAFGVYLSLNGSGTEYVRLTGTGGKHANLRSCRGEVGGSSTPTSILNAVTGSTGGEITGNYQVQGVGPCITIPTGQSFSSYRLAFTVTASGTPTMFSAGLVRQCDIDNTQNYLATVDDNSWNNIVKHQASRDWFANCRAAGWTNLQLTENLAALDFAKFNAVGVTLKGILKATVAVQPGAGSVLAGVTTTNDVTLTGAAVGDAVTATPSTLESGMVVVGAWVQAADTIRIKCYNSSGSTVTTSNRNWVVTAMKF